MPREVPRHGEIMDVTEERHDTKGRYGDSPSPARDLKGSSLTPEVVEARGSSGEEEGGRTVEDVIEEKRGFFAYMKTKDFYIVLVLG